MIDSIIGGTITFFAVAGASYLYHKLSRKKHWSQGYVVLGNRDYLTRNKKEEQPQSGTSGSDSMFPPGWG